MLTYLYEFFHDDCGKLLRTKSMVVTCVLIYLRRGSTIEVLAALCYELSEIPDRLLFLLLTINKWLVLYLVWCSLIGLVDHFIK